MAGEHIFKLLIEAQARITIGDRWMYVDNGNPPIFKVLERKKYQKTTRRLRETEDEEKACKILLGD